jgi:hypothetical protein
MIHIAFFQPLNYSWPYSTLAYNGNVYSDTMGFGGVLRLTDIPFSGYS